MTDEPAITPGEPAHITEAKRAADRTRVIAMVVILGILTVGIVLQAIRSFSRPGPVGLSIWVSIASITLAWVLSLRVFRKQGLLGGKRRR